MIFLSHAGNSSGAIRRTLRVTFCRFAAVLFIMKASVPPLWKECKYIYTFRLTERHAWFHMDPYQERYIHRKEIDMQLFLALAVIPTFGGIVLAAATLHQKLTRSW